MRKDQAEFLANQLSESFNGEQIILVESREWEHFVPTHVSLGKVGKISSIQEGQNQVLIMEFNGMGYEGLDNPVINQQTISFTVVNGTGQKIYRSFTLPEAKGLKILEMFRWIGLKFAL